jgi:DinB superfamily
MLMPIDKNELGAQGRQTCAALMETLEKFTPENFNRVPPDGGWTAAQVAEHLLLSAGVVEAIGGRTEMALRPADQHVDALAAIFLDFAVKFQAADFVLPEDKMYDQQEMIYRTKTTWTKLKEALRLLDLSMLCLDAEFPGMGHLTRLEWIWFYIIHTQRHLRQLNGLLTPAPTQHRLPLPRR